MTEASILRENHKSVAVLIINRPHVHNALDIATMRALGEAIGDLDRDEGTRVIVITGAGDIAFSAGGDIAEMTTFSPLRADALMQEWQDTLERIERSVKPVIAAVNGYAYGGGTELAMACHIRVASEDARFGQPEITLGHIPGAGGTQRLPRLVPVGIAYEYLLTGEPIAAEHAYRIGLVNYVWPKADLLPNTLALASKIAERGPVAVRYTLEAIRAGLNAPLPVGLRLERALAGLVLESAEAKAGLDAFLKKRGRGARKQP